jgi:hypothetical protein
MKELGDMSLGEDAIVASWADLGQDDEFASSSYHAAEFLLFVFGVGSTIAPEFFAAPLALTGIAYFSMRSEGLDDATKNALERILNQQQAAAHIAEKNLLLDMRAELEGRSMTLRSKLNTLATHKPKGAAKLALYEEMEDVLDGLDVPLAKLAGEEWLSAYDVDLYKSRVGLSPVLVSRQADGSYAPVGSTAPEPTRFDHRLGVPLLLYWASVFPTMLRVVTPWFRSTGQHIERLRKLAKALDDFVVRMQSETLARTEHSAQSLLEHEVYPSTLLFGSPLAPGVGSDFRSGTFPVGAFDLVRYTDGFMESKWSEAFGAGWDTGRLASFDYTWDPPPDVPRLPAWDRLADLDKGAVAANDQARRDYARLFVTSGATHLLIASGLLRYLSTPPDRSETVFGSAHASRSYVREEGTEARSPVIFPNVVVKRPATLRHYEGRNRLAVQTQEPGYDPALNYRVTLRTIGSKLGESSWRDRGYRGHVWDADYQPLPSDPQNKRLVTTFNQSMVVGSLPRPLYEGISPKNPVALSERRSVRLRAHTFDWYIPVVEPGWVSPVVGVDTHAHSAQIPPPRVSGALSVHLTSSAAPPPPMRVMSGPASALVNLADDFWDSELALATLEEEGLQRAERRWVREEEVTLEWQLWWREGELEVRLWGRPEDRSFQVFVVVEEAVSSGEPIGEPEWLHTPFAAEIVNQLVTVPQSFFDEEAKALAAGRKLWSDLERRFALSGPVGPGDPVAAAVIRGREMLAESRSTATLAEVLDMRLTAAKRHMPELWAQAVDGSDVPAASAAAAAAESRRA